MGPAAILSILCRADTQQATVQLTKFDAQLQAIQAEARKGIEARLGATLDPVGFERYKVATDRAARIARDRAAFKAELGANYSNRGFMAYERGVDKAIRDSARLAEASQVPLGTRISGGLKTTSSGMSQVGSTLNRNLTLPILGAAAAGVKFGVDFQTAMEQVHTQAGASQAEVAKMSRSLLELAPATEQGPGKLAKALYELESVGLRGARALAALRQASQLAAIGGADLQTSTSALASSMVAWQIKTKDAAHTAATLNAIVGAGKMHMQDLVLALGTKLPGTAHMLGISLTSVGAALAAFTDQGVNAETAATNLVTPLFKMAVVTAPKAKEALASIGLGVHSLANDFRTGGIKKAIEDLHNHLQGLTKNQQTDVVANAFGGSRGSAPILQLLATYDSATNSLKARQDLIVRNTHKWAGDMAAEHATASHKIKLAWSSIQTALIHIGDSLQPVVTQIAGMLTKVGAFFTGLSPSTRKFVIDIALAVAGLGAFLKIGGAVIKTFLALSRVVGAVGSLGKKLIGFFTESGAAADAETVQVNALAGAYERLALAQKGAGAGGLAPVAGGAAVGAEAGAGSLLGRAGAFAAGRVLPAAALAYLAYQGITFGKDGVKNQGPGGLAKLLGPTSAWTFGTVDTPGMHMSGNVGDLLQSFNPFAGHPLGAVKYVQNQNGQTKILAQLRNGLKNVSNASQLTSGQLSHYYNIVQKLIGQPDLTAKQRKGLAQLAQQLNPATAALNRLAGVWSGTFAGIDITTAHAMRQVTRAVQSSIHTLETNAPRGTRKWTTQMTGLIGAAWQKIQALSRAGVSGVGGAIASLNHIVAAELHKLGTMVPPGLLKGAESGGLAGISNLLAWAASQNSASKQGVSTQSEQGIAGRGIHYNVAGTSAHRAASQGGWNIPAAHRATARRHAAAKHMEWNPFTHTYQSMTSAHHSALRDLYISEFGVRPPTGPSHPSATSRARARAGTQSTAAGQQAALMSKAAGGQTAGGAGNTVQVYSQSAGFQIAMQQVQNALQTAQNSNNVAGQQRALGREIKLDRRAIGLDDRKLAQIAKQLRGSLTRAKRAQLMEDKLTVLQDLGQLRSDIGSAMSQLQSATSASAGTFDLAPAGGGITAPTIYDVRRAARAERKSLGEQHHHHGDVHIKVDIHDRKDVDHFADTLDRVLGSGVHARLRASGMRGT